MAAAYAETEGEWLQDAMVKGGLDVIITNSPLVYRALKKDPATCHKCALISSRGQLKEALLNAYHQKQTP